MDQLFKKFNQHSVSFSFPFVQRDKKGEEREKNKKKKSNFARCSFETRMDVEKAYNHACVRV